jgi:hypothetical protein
MTRRYDPGDSIKRADTQPTVRALLDDPLRLPRMYSLEAACARIADLPLDPTLAEMRQVIAQPITGEGCRRLHVLVSTLYHRAGASLALTEDLRAEIEAARTAQHIEE